jgi:hypothetical protein
MIDRYRLNKQLREEGKVLGIPLYTIFPKLVDKLPVLPKGTMWLISAATGIGKSKFARFLLFRIYRDYRKMLIHNNMQSVGYKPKFLIFLTEEDKNDFEDAIRILIVMEGYKIQ